MQIFYAYPEGKTKALTFSFDDGVVEDRRLIEIFNRYGLKGTFNINSGLGDFKRHLPLNKETAKIYEGHEIATHSVHHPSFNQIATTEIMREIWEDRKNLEELTDYPVTGHAYPNGVCFPELADMLRAAGIEYARTVKSTGEVRYMPDDLLFWHPTCHYRNALDHVESFLTGYFRPLPLLFYIWGHAYEAEDNNEWQLLEKLGSLLGGRNDIWYATNIEICRYIKAMRALIYSCDGKKVYNPSAIPVWFRYVNSGIDHGTEDYAQLFCVKPNETLQINN